MRLLKLHTIQITSYRKFRSKKRTNNVILVHAQAYWKCRSNENENDLHSFDNAFYKVGFFKKEKIQKKIVFCVLSCLLIFLLYFFVTMQKKKKKKKRTILKVFGSSLVQLNWRVLT